MKKKRFATYLIAAAFAISLTLIMMVRASRSTAAPTSMTAAALSFGSGNTVGDVGATVQDVVTGDLDNDGYPDLVSADGKIIGWQNKGAPFSGLWNNQALGSPGVATYALALGDLDNDGYLDVASGSEWSGGYEVQVWQNDGTPFDAVWSSNDVGDADAVLALAIGDLDNDGYLDLISGDDGAAINAWENDGTPFTGFWAGQYVGSGSTDVSALAVGDLDNDGDLDVVSGNASNRVSAWENDGDPFGGTWSAQTVFTTDDGIESLTLADADGDGDLDVLAGCDAGEDYEVTAWQNDGTPFAGTWTQHDVGKIEVDVYDVAAADFDVDGDPDLASGSQAHATLAEVRAWENGGSPFSGAWGGTDVGETGADVHALTAADLDRDGDPDLIAATQVITAWPNSRTLDVLGSWTEGAQPLPADDALSVDLADFDRDGKLDIAAGTKGSGIQVWAGDGGYTWTQRAAAPIPTTGTWTGVAWGQINNQNELDLAAAIAGGGLRAWAASQGGAVWDDISTGLPASGSYQDLALGHVNHDGLLDLVACGTSLGVGTWQGQGDKWSLQKVVSKTQDFCDLALGHVDHDGNLDVVGAHCNGRGVPVWLSDGSFALDPAISPTDSGSYEAVALGDLNDDGDTDLVAAPQGGGVEVWGGNGGTKWSHEATISPTLSVLSLDVGDFDNDGYLDILAGLQNGGVRVWKGDGGTSWTDASTNLATANSYYGVAFGRVDADAALDVVGAEYGSSGVRVWTAVEPPPGGWTNFQPYTYPPYVWATSQQLTCTVQVADVGSGLDVSTAQYRSSTSGGWPTEESGWAAAAVSGADGTTALQVMTATNVSFIDSDMLNAIQFRIRDEKGFTGTSPVYNAAIDATPPTNPAVVTITSHTTEVWDDSTNIQATWTDGEDVTSGVWGYSYEVTDSASTIPDEHAETSGNFGSDYATADGQNWYFHLRTGDRAGNWATDAVHVGPFWIDRTNPTNPATLESSSHTPGVWSNDPTVDVWWTAGDDGSGSGIAGYWYSWRAYQQDDPLDGNTADLSLSSGALSSGDSWYFNLRTRDNAGRRADEALHLGPFYIDTTDPTAGFVSLPGHEVNTGAFTMRWDGYDGDSGLDTFDVQSSENGTTWDDWHMGTTSRSADFTGERGETYYFRVRSRDEAGNVSGWSAAYDVTVGVDVTVRVEDEDGTPVSGAKVYRNGRERATTPGSGTVTLHHTLLNDELAAKYQIEEHSAHKGHHSGWAYRTYITSVDFDDDGNPQLHTITNTWATQVLTVRPENPLVGFHVLVSVEWDADSTFMNEVLEGFQSASAYLFDLTDGQMLWEDIEIVDDKRNWSDCDYRIHASNTEWPRAHVGGIWRGSAKHVYLGRYFDGNSSNQGPWDQSDAYRTTVHEFGHYGLGLYDEYLDSDGVEDGGCTTDRAITRVGEQASFMDYQYTATEMCSSLPTHPHNTDTYQHARHGEPCWNTVYYKYRDLAERWLLERPDHRGSIMRGPTSIPVDDWMYYGLDNWYTGVCPPFVTTWTYPDGSPAEGFRVWVENGGTIRQGETDSAGRITILGAHDGDTVRARGGSCGWFCVYSGSTTAHCSGLAAQATSEATVASEPFGFDLSAVPQETGEALEIRARASVALTATPQIQLWQEGLTETITVTLAYDSVTDAYTGTAALSPTLELKGQIWGQATDTAGHAVTTLEPFNVQQVSSDEHAWLRSDDGNMEVLLKPDSLVSDTMVSIAPSSEVSLTQGSLVVVGSAYQVNVSSGEYGLSLPAAVNMRYHAEMVSSVVTSTMRIYRWDAEAKRWASVGGTIGPDHNIVSAQTDHLSTFAIMGKKVGFREVYLPLILRNYP